MTETNFKDVEAKWQKEWQAKKAFHAVKNDKKKFYVLEMFPYPSATGLHMGHALNYTIGDIYARFKRLNGFNVVYPMGYDAFGLPAENAAIKAGEHPASYTENSMKNFIEQQKALGLSYDWDKTLATCRPDYYKWNQFFFIKLFEKGLIYRKKAAVNWCNECNTVLANEQVHGGKCWRHENTDVELKQLEQWFIKTTAYSDELLEGVKKLDWPDRIKLMQENWIGKSEGTEIQFEIETEHKANYVLLHGFTGSPHANFFPWLKTELEKKGHKVSVPELPNSSDPDVYEQVEYVLKHCQFDENTILLGHSLGSVVALKVLEKLNHKIKKLVLAAGFAQPKFLDKERPFEKRFDWKFDFDKIKSIAGDVVLLRASNDSAVPRERSASLEKAIGGKIVDFKAEDNHICGKIEPVVLANTVPSWSVFTTRADTLFGVTFLVISAQHSRLNEFVSAHQKHEVEAFLKKIKSVSEKDQDALSKEGVFTGSYAINPLTKERVPIWAGNFVLADYGSGMLMAVPAHDQRDFDFAKKYSLPIKYVIESPDQNKPHKEYGKLIHSNHFNGLTSEEAVTELQNELSKHGIGKKVFNYKFRDWLISRQRYWGTPIPFIYCQTCGCVPEKLENLPIKLPTDVKFGEGNPIKTSHAFVNTKCPKCGKDAKRETDTMDTFFDSSWYYLRYLDNHNDHAPFDKSITDYWMPVDLYVGGTEHACMHLIYARFFTKALRDMGMLNCDEPFQKLFNQGMLHGADGNKMSKSLGNVVNPLDIIKKYSADSLRFFLMGLSSPDSDGVWNDTGMDSTFRYITKMYNCLANKHLTISSKRVKNKINKGILEVTYDIENFKYNLAIIKLRDTFEYIEHEEVGKHELEQFVKLLHPFCPHMTEELWQKLGHHHLISLAQWPVADESAIDDKIDAADDLLRTTMLDIHAVKNLLKLTMINKITLIVSPIWKYDLYALIKAELPRTRNAGEILKTIMGTELKKHGQDITRIVPGVVKDTSKIPEIILTQQEELLALHEAKEKISETFDADVVIVLAEESQDAKAKNASPGKPAILLS